MRYKIVSRVISLFLALLFVFSGMFVFSFAAESDVPVFENIEETDVITDLKRMGIDITKYQKDLDAEHCRMLFFLEYGYDYSGSSDDYGLYIYLYNPTGKEIAASSYFNSIEMQISSTSNVDKDGLGFNKYKLSVCSYSTLQGYEHVFYKFKVTGNSAFLFNLNKDLRVYDISGIEVYYTGDSKPTDYAVGGTYAFSGYMPYHNSTRSARNTLKVNAADRLIIELELHPVSWKTQTSDKGVGYQYEMFSVYFAVPNDIIRDYGNPENEEHKGLVAIDGQYSKHKINGLVTNDQAFYNTAYDYIGTVVSDYNSAVPISFYSSSYKEAPGGTLLYSYYENPFNMLKQDDYLNSYSFVSEKGDRAYYLVDKYCSVFDYNSTSFEGFTHSDILSKLNSIWNEKDFFCSGNCGQGVLVSYGDNLSYTVNSGDDLTDQIATYASNHNKSFLGLLSGTNKLVIEDEVYDSAKSIQAIDLTDLYSDAVQGLFKEHSVIGANYFIDESDVESFVKFASAEAVKLNTTYLMRFSVEDYYCTEIYAQANGVDYNDGEYYFEKTIFKDIDIFSFTFENKYSQSVVIPVVASPIDNVGTVTPPAGTNSSDNDNKLSLGDDLNTIAKLLVLIAGILILAIIVFVFSKLFGLPVTWLFTNVAKVIVWILSLPFKFLNWIFNSIKTLGGAPLKKDDKDKKK